jgi:hypothetical protein
MSKKKEIKKIFENLEPESNEAHPELKDTVHSEPAQADISAGQEKVEEPAAPSEVSAVEPARAGEEETSSDDILEDVRKSLIEEEEAHEKEQQPKWWKRIGRSSRKKAVEPEATGQPEEITIPGLSAMLGSEETVAPAVEEKEVQDEYTDQIDELIDLLDREEQALEQEPSRREVDLPPAEPEKPVDIEELKKQAFTSRPKDGEPESLSEVRSIALEGDEEVFVEVESRPQDPFEERISAVENALTPYRRSINFAFAFLGLIMAVTAAFLIYNAYQRSQPQGPVVEEVSNLPFPTSVSLPGGWSFNLGRGALDNGQWNPNGAEWLQGTEVCRWVALPWSRQLEAVIRTLNQDDPIELGMSNNDILTYNVYTIRQMSPEEMQELDSNSPCLLIVLAEPETEERWVLTALP